MHEPWEMWVERYRAHLELDGLAERTVRGRTWLLGKFVAWARGMGIGSPEAMTLGILEDYRRYRIEYVNTRGHRDRSFTVNTHLLAMRSFIGFLIGRGVVPAGLLSVLRYVKQPRLLPRHVLGHADVMRMMRRVPADTPIHVRDRAVLEVLYSSAIRREELVMLAIEDLDMDSGVMRITHGKGSVERMAVIGRHAVEWLNRYIESARPVLMGRMDDHGRVFVSKRGNPLAGASVREIVRRWAKAAGIDKPVGPHTLRRSCATEMIRQGANPGHVKDLLGHADFGSLSAYVKLAVIDLKETLRRYHPREAKES